MMFKVLKIDGPNLVTDIGCVCISGFSYADGGKSHPVSTEDWRRMRDLFIAAPELLHSLRAIMGGQIGGKVDHDADRFRDARELLARFPV